MADTLQLTIKIKDDGSPQIVKFGKTTKKELTKVDKAFDKLEKKPAKLGKGFAFLKKHVIALGLSFAGVILGFKKMIGVTAEFEKKWKEVTTLLGRQSIADAFGKTEAQMQKAILGLAGSLGSAKDLTEALYQAISAGVNKTKALVFVEKAAMLAKAGLADLNTTTKLVASTMNVYGVAVEDATEITDALFKIVEQGITTLPELTASFGTITPFAKQAGISINELGASIAFLTASGLDTATAITALRSMIVGFIKKPSKEAAEAAKELGIEMSVAAIQTKGWKGVLEELIVATGGNIQTIARLFPEIRSIAAASNLASLSVEDLNQKFESFSDNAGTVERAVGRMEKSISDKWGTLVNQMEASLITIGLELKGTFIPALDALSKWFEGPGKKTISDFASKLKTFIDVVIKYKDEIVIAGIALSAAFALQKLATMTAAIYAWAGSISAATAELTKMSTILPVVAAFMSGWKVGKYIDSWLGIRKSIDQAYDAHMNFIRAKGTVATIDQLEKAGLKMGVAFREAGMTIEELNVHQRTFNSLTEKQQSAIQYLMGTGKSFTEAFQKMKDLGIKPAAEEIKKLIPVIVETGEVAAETSEYAKALASALAALGLDPKVAREEMRLLVDQIAALEERGIPTQKIMELLGDNIMAVGDASLFINGIPLPEKLQEYYDKGNAAAGMFEALGEKVKTVSEELADFAGGADIFKSIEEMEFDIDVPITETTKDIDKLASYMKESAYTIESAFRDIGRTVTGVFEELLTGAISFGGALKKILGGIIGSITTGLMSNIQKMFKVGFQGAQVGGKGLFGSIIGGIKGLFGKGGGAAAGGAGGAAGGLGGFMAGPWGMGIMGAIAAGPLIFKGLKKLFGGKPKWKKEGEELGRELGISVSDEFAKALQEDPTKIAELMPQFIEAGKVGTKQWDKLIAKIKEAGVDVKALLHEQLGPFFEQAAGGLDKLFASFKGVGVKGMERFDRMAMSTISAMQENGFTMEEIMTKLGPMIDRAAERFEELGMKGSQAFEDLARFREVAEEHPEIFDKLQGLNDWVEGMGKAGKLVGQNMKDAQNMLMGTINKAEELGLTHEQAIQQALPSLRQMLDSHNRLGTPLNRNTRELIAQAQEMGLLKGSGDKMVDSVNMLSATMYDIFGKKLPGWLQKATEGLYGMGDAARDVGNATGNLVPGGGGGGGGGQRRGGGKGQKPPTRQFGGEVRKYHLPPGHSSGLVNIHAGEEVRREGSGGSQPIILHNYVQIDGKTVQHTIERTTQSALNRKGITVPLKALTENP